MNDVFVNWKSVESLPDKDKNYVIFYREIKYINSINREVYQDKVDGQLIEVGDVLVKNEYGSWIHYEKKAFKEKFQLIN